MADQLCTLAQVKARLQTSAGGVTFSAADDTLINELIDQCSDWVEDYTHRKLVPVSSTTYVFDTVAGQALRVGHLGVRAITSMGVATRVHQPDTGGTYTTIPAADILLRPKLADNGEGWPFTEVRISRGTLAGSVSAFATIENGCTITATWGFAVTPPAIVAVTIDAVIAAFQSRKNGASGVIGADDSAVVPWVRFFSKGSPQRGTLDRFRYFAV